jgi:uncharacterized protein (TIGR02246 family)
MAKPLFGLFFLLAVPLAWGQSPAELVERYMAAYNDHDAAAMLELAHPDIQWLSIEGDEVQVVTEGRDALGEAMQGYFDSAPSSRSVIEATMTSGSRVSVRERAEWETASGTRSRAALAVYEIVDGLIRRVWYFPSD